MPPPPPVDPTVVASGDGAAPPAKGKGTAKKVVIAAGIIAVLAVGAMFAKSLLDTGSGGADSPEAAVQALANAVDNDDPAAVAAAVVPEEVRSLGEVVDAAETRAGEVGIAPKSKPYQGIDLQVEDLEYDVKDLGPGVAKVTIRDGSVSYEVEKDKLSDDAKDLADASELDTSGKIDASDFDDEDSSLNIDSDPYLIAVQRDGGWYVSLVYTAAEYYAEANDLDEGDYDPEPTETKPAETPEDAVEQFADAVGNVDVEATAEATAKDEWSALDVYRDTIEDELSRQQDDGNLDDVDFSIDDLNLKTEDLGSDSKKVVIEDASGDVSWTDSYGDQQDRSWDFDGSCLTVEDEYDDTSETCLKSDDYLERALAPEKAYVVVVKEGDGWVVSPTSTVMAIAKEAVPKITKEMILEFAGHPELAEPTDAIESGKTTTLKLNDAGFAVVSLSPTADRTYAISTTNGWVDVYDADGEEVSRDWISSNDLYELTKGEYKLVVQSDSYEDDGTTDLLVANIEEHGLPSATFTGQVLEGELTSEEPVKLYTFTPPDDSSWYLDVQSDAASGEIYSSSGDYVCSYSETCDLYSDEDYVLRVGAWPGDVPTDFAITLTEDTYGDYTDDGDDTYEGTISGAGDSFSGYLSDGDTFSFTVDALEDLSIEISSDEGNDIDCESDDDYWDSSDNPEVIYAYEGDYFDVTCHVLGGWSDGYTVDTYAY